MNGLLLLDKPRGLTSNAALQRAKRCYRARKAGHTGSLDPLASGMLPLCFGHATKVSPFLLDADKLYRVTALVGSKTDTGDADGRVIASTDKADIDADDLESVLAGFRGEIQQIPPMYSALKRDGRRLYELAREGKEVPREPRSVHIDEFEIESFDPQRPEFIVRCSKGTYIRTLVEDVFEAAGSLAHVAALRRLAVFPFADQPMVSLEELELAEGNLERLDAFLLPVDAALSQWPEVELRSSEAWYLLHGHPVNVGPGQAEGLVRLYDDQRRFLGIGESLADGRLAPKRLFVDRGNGRA